MKDSMKDIMQDWYTSGDIDFQPLRFDQTLAVDVGERQKEGERRVVTSRQRELKVLEGAA